MKKIFFIGIAGSGNAGLAVLMKQQGYEVYGVDNGIAKFKKILEDKGIKVFTDHSEENLDEDTDAICYTNAILSNKEEIPEYTKAVELGFAKYSYPEMIGEILSKYKKVVGVSGTHGKTTTTGCLVEATESLNPSFLVGSKDLNLQKQTEHNSYDLFIIESDEFLDSFSNYDIDDFIITNIEHDHYDAFPTIEEYKGSFKRRVDTLRQPSVIATDTKNTEIQPILSDFKGKILDYREYINKVPKDTILFGDHNIENMAAAYCMAKHLGVAESVIEEKIKRYSGTSLRMEKVGTIKGKEVFDDYAHHPTAVKRVCKALREKYQDKKIAIMLEPHQFSRVNENYKEYVSALKGVDILFLLPIFPAREKVDEGFDYKKLVKDIEEMSGCEVNFLNHNKAGETVLENINKFDILVTMSATNVSRHLENIFD